MNLELAISPCPNDTYIFYELAAHGFDGNSVTLEFADVEELNRRAVLEARHPVTKLSCFAMHAVRDRYRMLSSGGALGRGCGPLLLGTKPLSDGEQLVERLGQSPQILIPGRWTTAAFLTRSYLWAHGIEPDSVEFIAERYDRIMPELLAGRAQLGVIIHEERFTYHHHGLQALVDLGEFWEDETGHPIPLGCIAARRDLDGDLVAGLERAITASVESIRPDDPNAMDFIRRHAQALDDEVIQAHIELYVNDYSREMGSAGHAAMEELFRRANAFAVRQAH